MKKIILILALLVSFISCNKNSKTSLAPSSSQATTTEVWCVYKIVNGNYIFYKCFKTHDEAGAELIKIRDAGEYGTTGRKTNCSEC
jgi:hypothetical protein